MGRNVSLSVIFVALSYTYLRYLLLAHCLSRDNDQEKISSSFFFHKNKQSKDNGYLEIGLLDDDTIRCWDDRNFFQWTTIDRLHLLLFGRTLWIELRKKNITSSLVVCCLLKDQKRKKEKNNNLRLLLLLFLIFNKKAKSSRTAFLPQLLFCF